MSLRSAGWWLSISFFDRMSVHRKRFFVNNTNRCTEFQFYWYYDSTYFGQPFCPSSGVRSLHRLWYILCSCDDRLLPGAGWHYSDRLLPGAGWHYSAILLLAVNGHHNCIKCTKADVRLRTPDDGQKGCPKYVES